ncbi:MAG: hypothetical protein A2V93_10410 [Ignavibacteria bacterium RBG_16_34_14]|nr:MAG: hypothetical protein A2V93_10410 [Ignavibacteria bacterium RBG_16_34_14]
MDSTIIDGSVLTASNYLVYFFENSSTFRNFNIIGPGADKVGMTVWYSVIEASDCRISEVEIGLLQATSSVKIKRFIINIDDYDTYSGYIIHDACPENTCLSIFTENIFFIKHSSWPSLLYFFGGEQIIKNNIIIGEISARKGISFESQKRVIFKNNLVSGFRYENVSVSSHSDSVFLVNNNSMNVLYANVYGGAFQINQGDKTILKNNIIQNTNIGVSGYLDAVRSDYNLFNNVNTPVSNGAYLGEGNIFANPMFVNDTLPVPNGTYDLHLQKYSPAIDKGDPSITDVDKTRSDIGMYGGPEGETYVYLDLPPRTPKNFAYDYNTAHRILTLTWDMNTEYDFRNYNIYRDTISEFTPGEFNLIGQSDTSYYVDNLSSITAQNIYYRITAVDSQDNESQPGNEIAVLIVGVKPGVEILRDYILYQNYPNPFNPSTIISYEIKEHSYVKLMVYDIKGELIEVLVNKEQDAGYYEVEFDASVGSKQYAAGKPLASGIYLYRIEVIGKGNIPVYSDMKKMILIK